MGRRRKNQAMVISRTCCNHGTTPPCSLLPTDKRRVDIALNHLNVFLPEKDGDLPKVDGHVKVRFPVGLLERAVALPQTDGWIGLDLDVRYAEDTLIPDVSVLGGEKWPAPSP